MRDAARRREAGDIHTGAGPALETDVDAAEVNWKKKLEGLDAEVTLRARSGIAAAEAREAATARLAVMREAQAMKRLSVFAEAESKMAVREVEVSAREEAMEARVNGGVAEHLGRHARHLQHFEPQAHQACAASAGLD